MQFIILKEGEEMLISFTTFLFYHKFIMFTFTSNMKKKLKKKYSYNTVSIKIGTPYVEAVRRDKKKTGVSIQSFIENLIAKKLKVYVD